MQEEINAVAFESLGKLWPDDKEVQGRKTCGLKRMILVCSTDFFKKKKCSVFGLFSEITAVILDVTNPKKKRLVNFKSCNMSVLHYLLMTSDFCLIFFVSLLCSMNPIVNTEHVTKHLVYLANKP